MTHPARSIPFDELYLGLSAAVAEGLIYEKRGEGELSSLRLYCYSDECVYSRLWSPITLIARGLILDISSREVVATPFPKFFNHGELLEERSLGLGTVPDLPFETFEKMDGSLIILYYYAGRWRCATKGSLYSEQAVWAETWLNKFSILRLNELSKDCTYLSEAIYPSNRIVVNYGDKNSLELLGAYKPDGHEFSYDELLTVGEKMKWNVVSRYEYNSISELLAKACVLDSNSEGWVLRFSDGFRLKIKGEEYCRIHRLVSNLTPLTVWRVMLEDPHLMTAEGGTVLKEMRQSLPEEFWDDFDTIFKLLYDRLGTLLLRIEHMAQTTSHMSNKEIGIDLDYLPKDIGRFIFTHRKMNGDILSNIKGRRALFELFRPDRNVLEGYRTSSAIARVSEGE